MLEILEGIDLLSFLDRLSQNHGGERKDGRLLCYA